MAKVATRSIRVNKVSDISSKSAELTSVVWALLSFCSCFAAAVAGRPLLLVLLSEAAAAASTAAVAAAAAAAASGRPAGRPAAAASWSWSAEPAAGR